MVFEEQHRCDHDVGAGDVVQADLQLGRAIVPFGGGMHGELNPWQLLRQGQMGTLGSRAQVTVHRHDGHLHRRAAARVND